MNAYTLEELLNLAKSIDAEQLIGGPMDTPESALNNIMVIIENYQKEGPEAIYDKIKEFADIGNLISTEDDIAPTLLAYQILYEKDFNDMPIFINSEYAIIAQWRLNLPKAPTV